MPPSRPADTPQRAFSMPERLEMSETPNVVIESPTVRRFLNGVISYGTLAVGLLSAVDAASPAFDVSAYTLPAAAGLGYLLAALTAGVTIPNIPKREPADDVDHSIPDTPADDADTE